MRFWLISAALLGFLGVAIGAFGAHGLEGKLSEKQSEWFETASRYHFFHSLAMLAAAFLMEKMGKLAQFAAAGFGLGVLLFSGLLYAMALGAPTWFGAIVPLGGLAFLGGWLCLVFGAMRMKNHG